MFTPHCSEHVKQLLDRLDLGMESHGSDEGGDNDVHKGDTQGVSFHEFLVFCRRVKGSVVEELGEVFGHFDTKGTGYLSTSALPAATAELGFTLFAPAVEEFLNAIYREPGVDLSFDDFVSFIQECRKNSGFQESEQESLASVFDRFDTNGNGYVESLELLDLLRYLGYTTSIEDVRRFVAQADPGATSTAGVMDLTEFRRRMRLFREEEIQSVRQTFNVHCDPNTGTLRSERTLIALTDSGTVPRPEVFSAAVRAAGSLPALTFEDFMGIADSCREQTVAEKRKRGGFSEKSFRQVVQLFNKHKKKGQNALDKGELLWFLIEIGVPVSTREERAEVFGMLDKARASALHAGLTPEEVGPMGETSMTLWALLHLLRLVVSWGESKYLEHEEEAMDSTGFLRSELQEFRSIFESWVRRDTSNRAPASPVKSDNRRNSMPLIGEDLNKSTPSPTAYTGGSEKPAELTDLLGADEREGRLPIEALEMLLHSIGLSLDSRQEQLLRNRAAQVVAAKDGHTLDFADFLVIMRWMLDTNFADINDQTEQVVDRMSRVSPAMPPNVAEVAKAIDRFPRPAAGMPRTSGGLAGQTDVVRASRRGSI